MDEDRVLPGVTGTGAHSTALRNQNQSSEPSHLSQFADNLDLSSEAKSDWERTMQRITLGNTSKWTSSSAQSLKLAKSCHVVCYP